jgi:hypothetical protein
VEERERERERERESGRATLAAQQREGESGCDVGSERRAEREWKNENQWRKKKRLIS